MGRCLVAFEKNLDHDHDHVIVADDVDNNSAERTCPPRVAVCKDHRRRVPLPLPFPLGRAPVGALSTIMPMGFVLVGLARSGQPSGTTE